MTNSKLEATFGDEPVVHHVETEAFVTITIHDHAAWLRKAGDPEFWDFWRPAPTSAAEALKLMRGQLAYCCVMLGVEDASRLDGFADWEPGVVTMRISDVEVS